MHISFFSDDLRLIEGETHALRTNTNQNVKKNPGVYVKLLRKMKSGLENGDRFSINLLELKKKNLLELIRNLTSHLLGFYYPIQASMI